MASLIRRWSALGLPALIALALVALLPTARAQQTITTVVGGPVANVPATSIGLLDPLAEAYDSSGNLYLSDCSRIYKISPAGQASTVAGNGEGCLTDPDEIGVPGDGGPALAATFTASGIAVNAAGDIFLTDSGHNSIRKITAATGVISTIAGTGTAGFSGDGGPASQAELNSPLGLAMDAAGNLFIADSNNRRVREISAASGVIATVATLPASTFPIAWVALEGSGHLFAATFLPTVVYQINLSSGTVTTVAGGGTQTPVAGLAPTSAQFSEIEGLVIDSSGDLFLGDRANRSSKIWEVPAGSQTLALVAGGGTAFATSGPATAASFGLARVLGLNPDGDLEFLDSGSGNDYVLQLSSTGGLSVRAGNGLSESLGASIPALASTDYPSALDASHGLVYADFVGGVVRQLQAGSLNAIAGGNGTGYAGDGGPATSAQLGASVQGVLRDPAGNYYLADTYNHVVRRIAAATGVITTVVGNGTYGNSGDGGPAASAELKGPDCLALDAAGDLYIGDMDAGVVRRVDAITHIITTVAGNGTAFTAQSGDGGPATSAAFHDISGIALDAQGNLYIADSGAASAPDQNGNYQWVADGSVRRVAAQTGIITAVAGLEAANPNPFGFGDGGPATQAALTESNSVALDPAGNIYIADTGAAEVREVIASTGTIVKLAGTNQRGGDGGDGGPAAQATLRPYGLAFDPSGNLFVSDSDAGYVREIAHADGRPQASPSALAFGNQLIGAPSTPLTVTLTNPGLAPDSLGAITAAGDFGFTTNCGATLAAGASCTVSAVFTPTASGPRTGQLQIPTTYGTITESLGGTGIQPAAALTPPSLTFPAADLGGNTVAQPVTLANPGSSPLKIGGVSVTGPFSQTNNCGTTLAAGASCTINVVFAPTAAGPATGSLVVSDNAPGGQQSVPLAGSAVAALGARASQIISTVAGGPVSSVPATSVGLFDPIAATFDANGNFLLGECARLYRVDAAGNATTFAGNGESCTVDPGFVGIPGDGGPALTAALTATGMTVNPAGDILFSDFNHNSIREISASTGIISTLAGNGVAGFAGDGGPAAQAEFNSPCGILRDSAGNLFIADEFNSRVREIIAASGIIQTVATLPVHPDFLAFAAPGQLLAASQFPGKVYSISLATGAVTPIAGGGTATPAAGAAATSVTFQEVRGLSVDAAGDIFFSGGTPKANKIWEIPSGSQNLTLFAGGGAAFATTGSATSIAFPRVRILTADAAGNLYVDSNGGGVGGGGPTNQDDYVLRITPGGAVSLVMGNGTQESVGASLPARSSTIYPAGMDASSGTLLIADFNGERVRQLSNGNLVAVAGSGHTGFAGDGAAAASAQLSSPAAVVRDAVGDLYIADSGNHVVRRVDAATGFISTFAGNGTNASAGDGGPATSASLQKPVALALDAAGDLFIADENGGRVRRVDATTQVITTVAGSGNARSAQTGDGGPATSAQFYDLVGVAVDARGDLYTADAGVDSALDQNNVWQFVTDSTVRRVDAQTGIISTVAGQDQANSDPVGFGDGGPATAAALSGVEGIALDPAGNLYIAEENAALVREVAASTGIIQTVAGTLELGGDNGDGGPAALATLRPCTLAFDPSGNLYVADCAAFYIREIANGDGRPAASSSSLSFGAQLVATSKASQTVTIVNPGVAPDALGAVMVSGNASGDYSVSSTCGVSLAPGASCTLTATFTPTAAGDRSGVISLADGYGALSIALDGAGIALPVLQVSPASLAFASQAVGSTSAAANVVVLNTSTSVTATMTGITTDGDFSATSTCGAALAPGAQCVIAVTFTPTLTDTRTATLTIADNASNSPQQVALSGSGIPAGVSISPASLKFGSATVGSISSPLAVAIANNSAVPLTVNSITASANFAVTGACPSIPAGGTCSLGVTFSPAAVGPATGTLTISDNAAGGTQTVPLAGLGTAAGIIVSPANLDFAAVLVGTTSFSQAVILSNTGTAALTALAVPSQIGDFFVTSSGAAACGSTLAAGSACVLTVTMKPSAAGADAATLAITDNLGAQDVSLAGTGITPGVQLSSSQLNFGSQTLGLISAAQTLVLTNTGTSPLSVTGIATGSASFSETDNCLSSSPLAVGASCGINITFTPAVAGPAIATLAILDSAGGHHVSLSGTGVVGITLSPSAINFGSQELGGLSLQQTVSVANTGVTAFTLKAVLASGDFQVTQNLCVAPVAPGGTCQIFVAYAPSALGASQGALTLSDGTGAITAVVSLSGTGTRPGISAAPAALAFGGSPLGVPSLPQTVTITNNGTATLNLQAVSSIGDFSVNGDTCLAPGGLAQALAPAANCVISLQMTPTTLGSRSGALVISNDADGALVLALSGSGEGPNVIVGPAQLSFGSQPIPGAGNFAISGAPQIVTVANHGDSPLAINSIATSGGFTQTNNCGASVAAGTSCTISVSFQPAATGQWNGVLVVNDNASGGTQAVTLTGFGSPNGLTLSPSSFSFGGVAVGETSAPQSATLTNGTGQAISGLAIVASGEFNQTNTCGPTLAAGASCTITVTATPQFSGAINGAIAISGSLARTAGVSPGVSLARAAALATRARPAVASAAGSLARIAVTTGGDAAALTLSTARLSFANQPVGVASAAQSVTITNASTSTAVTGLAVTSSPDFPATSTCQSSLPAGATCTLAVTFQPTAAGARTGTLTVAAANGLQSTLALSGTASGGTLAVSPGTLNFGARAEGTASATQSLQIQNTGTAAFSLQSFTSSNSDFALATTTCGTLPATLAPGAACAASIVFQPSTTGAESATLTVTSNASNGNAVIGLSGSGSTQGLSLSPSVLQFGVQGQGLASAPQNITLANPSASPVAISSIAAGGDFTQTNNCGASLAAGAHCTVAVVFTPSATGARTGALTVADSAATQVAGLSGSGANFTMSSTSDHQTVTAGASATFQLAMTPGAFSGTVGLACSGAPENSTCSTSPASLALTAGSAASTAKLTVSTIARAVLPPSPVGFPGDGTRIFWLFASLLGFVLALAVLVAVPRRRRGWLLTGVVAAALLAAGCAGNQNNLPTAGGGTPAGTYTLTVTATAGSNQQTTTLTLVVY